MVRGRVNIYPRAHPNRRLGAFALSTPDTRWKVSLRRTRAYILEVFVRFETVDGRRGDTAANLGMLVSRWRAQRVVILT
jgi:hypothetical protein